MQTTSSEGRNRLVTQALLTSVLLLLSTLTLAQSQDNPYVTGLLEDARDKAAVLSRDADELEALTRSDVSWQTHADMLERVKEHVNDLGRAADKLNGARDQASPWQRQAIDRMMPLLKELADNTTAAINHLKENKTRPTTPAYTEYLRQNDETAHQLSDLISSFVRYGKTKEELDKLEQKLEVATK
jgi:hypothetical protein